MNGRVRRVKRGETNNFTSNVSAFASNSTLPSEGVPELPSVAEQEQEPWSLGKDCRAMRRIITDNPLNILLIIVPFAIASGYCDWGQGYVFSLNFIAILPLAAVLGSATEELAASVGETLGGLLNATFGNAVEMILAVYALRDGLVDVVQDSLLGSILSNLLLVLGMSFFCGGIKFHSQKFNPDATRMQSSLLLLAVLALAVPTMVMSMSGTHMKDAKAVHGEDLQDSLDISRWASVILTILYVAYLFFQIKTHPEQFASEGGSEEEVSNEMSCGCALIILMMVTMVVAVCSELLVGTIEGITEKWDLSRAFVGVVLLPIVGNAAEHATAVTVAYKDKMDLSLGVALGSSTQIALFVVPFTVVVGWIIDVPMDLNFKPVATGILLLTVLIVCGLTSDGQSNWMEGLMLLGAYFLIAVTFSKL